MFFGWVTWDCYRSPDRKAAFVWLAFFLGFFVTAVVVSTALMLLSAPREAAQVIGILSYLPVIGWRVWLAEKEQRTEKQKRGGAQHQ